MSPPLLRVPSTLYTGIAWDNGCVVHPLSLTYFRSANFPVAPQSTSIVSMKTLFDCGSWRLVTISIQVSFVLPAAMSNLEGRSRFRKTSSRSSNSFFFSLFCLSLGPISGNVPLFFSRGGDIEGLFWVCSASKLIPSSVAKPSYWYRFTFSTFPWADGVGQVKNPAGQLALDPERRVGTSILLLL